MLNSVEHEKSFITSVPGLRVEYNALHDSYNHLHECVNMLLSKFISTPVISNYWYLKVNLLGPENLLLGISSLR